MKRDQFEVDSTSGFPVAWKNKKSVSLLSNGPRWGDQNLRILDGFFGLFQESCWRCCSLNFFEKKSQHFLYKTFGTCFFFTNLYHIIWNHIFLASPWNYSSMGDPPGRKGPYLLPLTVGWPFRRLRRCITEIIHRFAVKTRRVENDAWILSSKRSGVSFRTPSSF